MHMLEAAATLMFDPNCICEWTRLASTDYINAVLGGSRWDTFISNDCTQETRQGAQDNR